MLRNEVPTGLIVEFASRAIHRMPTRKSPTAVQPVYEYCVNASFENKLPDWGRLEFQISAIMSRCRTQQS